MDHNKEGKHLQMIHLLIKINSRIKEEMDLIQEKYQIVG